MNNGKIDSEDLGWQGQVVRENRNLKRTMSELVDIIKQYHKDVGPCDHEVGICLCGEYSVLDDALKLLKSE
jgi:hypothetical protein